MNVYQTQNIRNVVVLGHGSCGKTTLVESAAYVAGVTKRLGRVVDGTTISDFDKEEQKRQFLRASRSTSSIPRDISTLSVRRRRPAAQPVQR